MNGRTALGFALCGWLLAAGCENEVGDHPPAYPECLIGSPGCRPVEPDPGANPPQSSGGQPGGNAEDGGSGGVGGSFWDGHGGAADAVTVTGIVTQFVEPRFEATAAYLSEAVIEAAGFDSAEVSAEWDGANPFELDGALGQRPLWLSVRPRRDAPNELRTLHPVFDFSRELELGIVRRDVFEQAVLGQLPQSPRLNDDRAQIVLFVSDADDRRLADIVGHLAEAELIAYSRSGGWLDDADSGTDPSGLMVFGNVRARDYPGNDVRLTLSGAADGFVEIRVAAGAVTVAEIVVE